MIGTSEASRPFPFEDGYMATTENREETLRKRAAEARRTAEIARDEKAKVDLLQLAELYERLAEHARERPSQSQ